ncbi:MAG: hypothetical protein KAR14_06845 [Candidatus Aminicenantes bacterium]|nr:hypothetical protein [Candidatus Aminicenantes bacterium]
MKKYIVGISFFVFIIFIAGSMIYGQSIDLKIRIKCPGKAVAGQSLKESIQVFVTNSGKTAAKNFSVDLIISKNASAPMKYAVYSATFKEDALLLGGREFIAYLGAGQTTSVKLNGNNRIPGNTPTGLYFLGAIVDPGNSVPEFNEKNNMDFCRMKIKGAGLTAASKYDIDITDVYLDNKCRIWIKHTNNGTKKIDKVFREKVWVNGILKTNDTEHIVLEPGAWTAHGVGANPGVIVSGAATIKAKVDVDNVLAEFNEANNTKIRNVRCKKLIKPLSTVQLNRAVLRPQFIRRDCPDPAAHKINFTLLQQTATFTGRVQITGVVKNVGLKEFKGGGGMAYLYEGSTLRKTKVFSNLLPGGTISLSYIRTWYAASPSEGEFPPTYKLVILYDPDILLDGNKDNDDCTLNNNKLTRSGSGINDLLR